MPRIAIRVLFCLVSLHALTATAAPPQQIALGVQPLGYPVATITSVMKRDLVLAETLARSGKVVVQVPFAKGSDMVDRVGRDLCGAFLGDMPTILTATGTGICIVGLVKQTFSSVVARKSAMMQELAGKRIGYAPGSSAHKTLLQGLKAAGLSERDVHLVPVTVSRMPEELSAGTIDAYAAWEPAPSITLAKDPLARVLFRGVSTDYFLFSRDFVQRHPDEALAITASFLRAVAWMRTSRNNLRQAAQWSMADYQAYAGARLALPLDQVMEITARELLAVPSAPVIPSRGVKKPRLVEEFQFLQELGKLPKAASLAQLQDAFGWDGLARVLASPERYHLKEYRYRP